MQRLLSRLRNFFTSSNFPVNLRGASFAQRAGIIAGVRAYECDIVLGGICHDEGSGEDALRLMEWRLMGKDRILVIH